MDSPESSDLLRTRVSLLHRLKDPTDADSWGEFFQRYQLVVKKIARSRGLADHEAEEVALEVFQRVAQTIQRFEPSERPGSFRAWLFRLTHWRSVDKLNERLYLGGPSANIDDHIDDHSVMGTQGDEIEREARQNILEVLFHRLEKSTPQKQLQIFRMIMIDEVPVEKVCALFKITKGFAYVIRSRLTVKLQEEAAKLPLCRD